MNSDQKKYFKSRLIKWRESLIKEQSKSVLDKTNEPDLLDTANNEADQNIKLVSRTRSEMLVSKIDQALKRMEDGSYGYCEETGEEIDINRLIARPIAVLSVEAQEKQEKLNKQNRMRVF